MLIDDLVTKGTQEPYRMFTSRAEYRTLLRQDNADLRLTELGYKIGLADEKRYEAVIAKKKALQEMQEILSQTSIAPNEINSYLESVGSAALTQKAKGLNILLRPNVTLKALREYSPLLNQSLAEYTNEHIAQAEIQIKYAGYIKKEEELAAKMMRLDDIIIPETFNYHKLTSLSAEAREKMTKMKPRSLGQASRISGVSPSDISVLMVFMGR